MAVAYATLSTDIYTQLYNHLQSDTTYAISTDNIYPNFNSSQLIKNGYPQVIIKVPETSTQRVGVATESTLRRVPFSVEIEVYHNSALNVKATADEVRNAIITGAGELMKDGLNNLNFDTDEVVDTEYQENKSVYTTTLTLTGRYMVKV